MKRKLMTVLLIILLIIFGISSYNIIKWTIHNKRNDNILNIIEDKVNIEEITQTTTNIIQNNTTTQTPNMYYDYTKVNLIDVNFEELKKINKDTKGWIQVLGTNINYPYVQGKNNKYYLTRSFDKKYTDAGWVFMDYRNNSKDFDKNTLIFAHARKNNTMFGELDKVLKKDWFSNSNNHFIKISTETTNSIWQIFSVYHIPTTNDYMQINFKSNDEFYNLIKIFKQRSKHNFKVTLSKKDKILTLSTCYKDDSHRVVVHAKLLK